MVIRYCDHCGKRVEEDALESGQARELAGGRVLCETCLDQDKPAPEASPHRASPSRLMTPAKRDSRRLTPAANAGGTRLARGSSHKTRPAEPPANRSLLIIGIVVVVIILVAGTALMLHEDPKPDRVHDQPRSSQDPTETTPSPPQTTSTSDAGGDGDYDPRSATASSLLAQAKAYREKQPQDRWGFLLRLEELREKYPKTGAAREAAQLQSTLNLPPSAAANELPPESDWERSIDLLFEAAREPDTIGGEWQKTGTALISPRREKPSAFLILPYRPPDEYDVKVVLVRRDGDEAFCLNLPRHEHVVSLLLGAWHNRIHGFETVAGKRADRISSNLSREGLVTGQPQTLIVQVRHGRFKAHVDGTLIAECRAYDEDLGVYEKDWKAPRPRQLALGSWNTSYEIREVRVIERTGKGEWVK